MVQSHKSAEHYASLLRAHQLKATPQRSAIAEALEIHGHLNIEALYELLKQKLPTLSLATIYKNLHSMIDKNFVAEVKLPGAKSVYELVKEQHSHLVCEKCGKVEDISLTLEYCIDEANAKSNFTITQVDIVLRGRCHQCQ